MENILKEFIVGSSYFVVLPFYISVMNLQSSTKNYSYEKYTLLAPVYLGFMNIISGILQRKFNLTDRKRYVLIGLVSPIIVIAFAKFTDSYNFNKEEWINYSLKLIAKHFLIFNFVVYYLNFIFEK